MGDVALTTTHPDCVCGHPRENHAYACCEECDGNPELDCLVGDCACTLYVASERRGKLDGHFGSTEDAIIEYLDSARATGDE